MEIEAFRNRCEIFCFVCGENITEDDVLLYEEEIRSTALEESLTAKEEDIIMNSDIVVVPRDAGGFYVEFEGFFE